MSMLSLDMHPTFDTLSAHADLGDVAAARTRVGRHVAKCAACRDVVAEIGALGESARGMEMEAASPALWDRILLAHESEISPRPASAELADVNAASRALGAQTSSRVAASADTRIGSRPSTARSLRRASRRLLVLGGITIAAAGALAAVMLVPNRSFLMATGPSRLTFSPGRPVPGGTMTVRYRPAPWLASAPRLVLVGRYAPPVTRPDSLDEAIGIEVFGDSLTTLKRLGDGSFEGTLRLPSDFLAVRLMVSDSAGEERDADGHYAWLAIGGTISGAPSLDALLAARERPSANFDVSRHTPQTQAVSVADSIQRYFPGHPAGWAYYDKFGLRAGIFDMFRYFDSAERRYASLDAKLWPMPSLDAQRLHDMATFARRIAEPEQARKWTERLVREHPEDPRALRNLAEALHDIELKPVTNIQDSIRPWIPVLDSLYRRSGANMPSLRAIDLVNRYGDSSTKAGWPLRRSMALPFVYRVSVYGLPDTSAQSVALAREFASTPCERPSGKFLLGSSMSTWRYVCEMRKSATWSYLSAVDLARVNARGALVNADSGVAYGAPHCIPYPAIRARARARIALGDTVGAAQDFAVAFGVSRDNARLRIEAQASLGERYRAAAFDAVADSARQSVLACRQARKAREAARVAARQG